jgi:hypothetical protein
MPRTSFWFSISIEAVMAPTTSSVSGVTATSAMKLPDGVTIAWKKFSSYLRRSCRIKVNGTEQK